MQSVKLLLALLVGAAIGYFVGKSTTPATVTTTDTVAITPSKPIASTSSSTSTVPVDTIKDLVAKTTVEDTIAEVEPIEKTVEPLPTKPTPPIASNNPRVLPRIKMGISDKKISEILSIISANLEAKKLAYKPSLLQDCSGIFHQLKDSLQVRLPALKASATYEYPSPNIARSSRQIANWYHERRNLIIVEDAIASQESIRPGTVLFFGKSGKKYKNITIEQLTDRDNNFTSNGIISHVAIVTNVVLDENGKIKYYTMMHGRNSKKHAARTDSKEVQSKFTKGLPPFGYWSKQLVAVANVATPKSS
ncbi:MAG: hypothetical protein AB8G22_01430 [Saprospiraceae bacterium]